MNRQKADLAVVPKGVLRSVAMMNIPVDDQHSIQLVFARRHARGDRNVVKQAKTHRSVSNGMVPRRPNDAQGLPIFAADNAVYGVANSARGAPRHLVRSAADDGVG